MTTPKKKSDLSNIPAAKKNANVPEDADFPANSLNVEELHKTPGNNSGDPNDADADDVLFTEDSDDLPVEIDDLAGNLSVLAPTDTSKSTDITTVTNVDQLLKQYIREVSQYPLLVPAEELRLARRLRDENDLEAAKQLVQANLRLVVKIAMEYRSATGNVLDLIQEGNIGLMKAVSKYDPDKGAKLSYYASWWIRSFILKYILDNFRLVRVGTTHAQKKLFYHLMREKNKLEAQGIDAQPKLLADKLDVKEQEVVEMEHRLGGLGAELSLNAPVYNADGGHDSTFVDQLRDGHTLADDELAQDQLKAILASNLDAFKKTLKEKELAIFRYRMAAEEPATLQEVADIFGLTRERARQIEAKVIEKLRLFFKQKMNLDAGQAPTEL